MVEEDDVSYGKGDLRSRLAPAASGGAEPCADPQYIDFTEVAPEIDEHGGRTWWVRGQNFALAYTIARSGAVLTRTGQRRCGTRIVARPGPPWAPRPLPSTALRSPTQRLLFRSLRRAGSWPVKRS